MPVLSSVTRTPWPGFQASRIISEAAGWEAGRDGAQIVGAGIASHHVADLFKILRTEIQNPKPRWRCPLARPAPPLRRAVDRRRNAVDGWSGLPRRVVNDHAEYKMRVRRPGRAQRFAPNALAAVGVRTFHRRLCPRVKFELPPSASHARGDIMKRR
jgi:hypothetical protein